MIQVGKRPINEPPDGSVVTATSRFDGAVVVMAKNTAPPRGWNLLAAGSDRAESMLSELTGWHHLITLCVVTSVELPPGCEPYDYDPYEVPDVEPDLEARMARRVAELDGDETPAPDPELGDEAERTAGVANPKEPPTEQAKPKRKPRKSPARAATAEKLNPPEESHHRDEPATTDSTDDEEF